MPDLLSVADVAALLKLRPVTIYRWCRAGRLAAVKIGKEWRIPGPALAAALRLDAQQWAADIADRGAPMNELSSSTQALARDLLVREAGGSREPAALADALDRACRRLRGRLVGLIGQAGFAALLARALRLAIAERPALAAIALDEGEDGCLSGTRAFALAAPPAEAEAGLVAVLAHLVGLLATFIGEDLALRLVRDALPELAGGGGAPGAGHGDE